MVQVDPIEVPSTAAYEKYAAARPCVLSTEQSRGFKCGICLGELAQPGRRFPATPHAADRTVRRAAERACLHTVRPQLLC